MAQGDRMRWDERYRHGASERVEPAPPPVFAPYEAVFPSNGRALDVACGRGGSSVWLARRGLEVIGLDVSPVAVDLARVLARRCGVEDRCTFAMVDLDEGLPPGPPVAVVLCHLFRDARLDAAIVERLEPGGLLAIAALSEVDAAPGPFRVKPHELRVAFADLEVLAGDERDGRAWLLARRPAGG